MQLQTLKDILGHGSTDGAAACRAILTYYAEPMSAKAITDALRALRYQWPRPPGRWGNSHFDQPGYDRVYATLKAMAKKGRLVRIDQPLMITGPILWRLP